MNASLKKDFENLKNLKVPFLKPMLSKTRKRKLSRLTHVMSEFDCLFAINVIEFGMIPIESNFEEVKASNVSKENF